MKTETVVNLAIAGAVLYVLYQFQKRLQTGAGALLDLPGKIAELVTRDPAVQVKAAAKLPNGVIVDFNQTMLREENGLMTFYVGSAKYQLLPRDTSGYYGAQRIYPKTR